VTTDYTPSTCDLYADEAEACELCGVEPEEEGSLAICEGVLCCEECAREYGWELVGFADAMSEELRRA
jgi:hypothetical protein